MNRIIKQNLCSDMIIETSFIITNTETSNMRGDNLTKYSEINFLFGRNTKSIVIFPLTEGKQKHTRLKSVSLQTSAICL